MPTVFIANLAVSLPVRFNRGDIIGDNAAQVLNLVQLNRIRARLRWMLSRGDINADGLQAKAIELSNAELVPYAVLDDDEEGADPIFAEALAIARELIVSRMAEEGLPPPKGLDNHARALVDGMPELHEKARKRIEEKYRAAEAAIGG